MTGSRRIMAEFKHLQQHIGEGTQGAVTQQLSDLSLVCDDLFKWRVKIRNFDNDLPGGHQINLDLEQLKCRTGQDYILMEILFPDDYPNSPFFVRVVSPRCMMYTGHVTVGGSICIEAIVPTGGPNGWQAAYSVESILATVIMNMADCEVAVVRTATGPGGLSGPLRIDLKYGTLEYGVAEAKAAFQRMARNHGWKA